VALKLPSVEAKRDVTGWVYWNEVCANDQRDPKGMRCRTTKVIRTHGGLLGRFTEGTIQGVIDNLGRQLIGVEWDSSVTTYVFINEIEIKTRLESEVSVF
jgi:hypothetical protein